MINLSAKPVVEAIRAQIQEDVKSFYAARQRLPRLAVILVGSNPASVIYTRKKGEAAVQLGMEHETLGFPATATPAEVKLAVDRLNSDPAVDGILIQRPLPPSFREEEVLNWVAPEKDVDCFHPNNVGRLLLGLPGLQPCTPAGIMELLRFYKIEISGKVVCVIGRSSIVGKPMAALLLQANATILHCHSKTPDLKKISKQADLLVVATGQPAMIDASYVKPGAVVVDVGMHRNPAGKVSGDVDFASVAPICSAITPVPGGVGPMTITMLLANTILAANRPLPRVD